jgi:pilus assembly protein CpaC
MAGSRKGMSSASWRVGAWALALLAVCAAPVAGQVAQSQPAPVEAQHMKVYLHQSQVVDLPWPAKGVAVTDPKIADVQVLSPSQALVQGKAPGATDLIAWSEEGKVWRATVAVGYDLARMQEGLTRLFPTSPLRITQGQDDFLVLSGQLSHIDQTTEIKKYMDATGAKYVDMTKLAGVQQVQLRVRVAEVSRTSLRVLGFNAFVTGNDFFGGINVGSSSGGALNPVSIGVPSGSSAVGDLPFSFTGNVNVNPLVTIFAGFPKGDLEFFLQALAENQYLRILAEPTLVALSGETASFLVGGEFPIPVVQGGGSLQSVSVTIEYKEFGIRLKFRPTVLGDGTIRLYVAPEVSQLSDVGAVVQQGFRIPSLITRRAETTLEIHSGESFAMAGLINRAATGTNSRIPGLGDIPVLGVLFRSTRYESDDTDLVVMVTADTVEPMATAKMPLLPGSLHSDPTDWEFYALGRIEGEALPKTSPAQAKWLREMGLDRLKGEGAWETYDQKPVGDGDTAPPAPEIAPAPTSRPAK